MFDSIFNYLVYVFCPIALISSLPGLISLIKKVGISVLGYEGEIPQRHVNVRKKAISSILMWRIIIPIIVVEITVLYFKPSMPDWIANSRLFSEKKEYFVEKKNETTSLAQEIKNISDNRPRIKGKSAWIGAWRLESSELWNDGKAFKLVFVRLGNSLRGNIQLPYVHNKRQSANHKSNLWGYFTKVRFVNNDSTEISGLIGFNATKNTQDFIATMSETGKEIFIKYKPHNNNTEQWKSVNAIWLE